MSEQPKKMAEKRSFYYTVARGLAFVLFHTIGPVRYHGRENIPAEVPYILIGNHNSFMDPVVMAATIKRHEISFLGKKELVKNRIVRHIFTHMHMIMVDRHNSDMEAMRTCTRVLREGAILGIFPEGTRHHEGLMTQLESGIGLIALRANVPLVPMYITPKYGLFRRTHCYIGKPIDFADLRAEGINSETGHALLERITAVYAEMERAAKAK